MNRVTNAGLLMGVAVLLTSCTSKSGAATTSANASSSSSSAMMVSAGGVAKSSANTSSVPVSAPASSAPASSAPASSAPASSAPASGAPASGASGSSGPLDVKTAVWFTAFCGGLTPVLVQEKTVQTTQAAVAKTDYAAQQKRLVDFLTAAGPQITDTGAKLAALAAPTFAGGVAFAAKVVEAFGKTGPELIATGQKLAAADLTKGASALSSATPDLPAELASIAAPITAVGQLDIPEQIKGELLALPACAKLLKTVTG